MVALSFIVKAEDKSYIRDRSECRFETARLNLEIRSPDLYTQHSESEYGNTITLKHNGQVKPIVMNEAEIGRYRFLSIHNSICSKGVALPINEKLIAFLFLKDNRPFTDQLTILYYNIQTKVTEVISTKVSIKNAFLKDGKVYLRHSKDQSEQKFGSLIMDNKKFNYVEKHFEPWVSFDGQHFKTDMDMSFDAFEHKHLLDRKTFSNFKQLNKLTYKLATHGAKNCLSFENLPWVCK